MKPVSIGAFEAKTRLSEILEKVRLGQTFIITKHDKPVAELRPVVSGSSRPRFGCDRGRVELSDEFDAPIPEFDEYTQ